MKTLLKILNTQPNSIYFCILSFTSLLGTYYVSSFFYSIIFFVYSPIMWTFQEYLAHRILMHHIEPIKKTHFKHHFDPNNESKIFIPIFFTISFSAINLTPVYYFFGFETTIVNFSSWIICYFLFEFIHWSCHCMPDNKYLKGPRVFHILHHTKNYDNPVVQNFGFTSASWDFIFNTCDSHTKNLKYSWILYIPYPVLPLIIVGMLN